MIYDIQSKSDIMSGTILIVSIPEEDLDRKALFTILEDRPEYILPFQYRIIDGQVEFIYQIGTQSKLQYIAGERLPKDYTELWSRVLDPLFECSDWFLRPFSFVLDIRFLYCDKNSNSVAYVYIPSLRDCCDYYDLKEMATQFSRQITVSDTELENRVLRAIMMDFNPKAFLKMLKTAASESISHTYLQGSSKYQHDTKYNNDPKYIHEETRLVRSSAQYEKQHGTQMIHEVGAISVITRDDEFGDSPNEIMIQISEDGNLAKSTKDSKNKKNKQDSRKANNKRDGKANKRRFGFFGRKSDNQAQETNTPYGLMGASQTQSVAEFNQAIISQNLKPAEPEIDETTQSITYIPNGSWLRLVGNADVPSTIEVCLTQGEIFTIGRYDTSIGKSQSNFEFDRMTKAISRRHAAIERQPSGGYSLIDLSSNAGTYLDGQRLPPNTPCALASGARVSFGNCGADYIWEE